MKSYEELLSDIEEDMELMGSSHIVYSMEEAALLLIMIIFHPIPVRSPLP